MKQNELQKTFIAMLFAFVASAVALQLSNTLVVLTEEWTKTNPVSLIERIIDSEYLLLSAMSHSLLALMLFSMSWVMWSKSQAAGHIKDIESVFSLKYTTLLLEVLLVVMYFSIVNSAEGNIEKYKETKQVSDFISNPSAYPEAKQMIWVFAIFAIWDIIVDVIKSPKASSSSKVMQKGKDFIQGVLVYCTLSVVCLLAALWVSLNHSLESSAINAVIGDISLILILLFFNRAKCLEYHLLNIFPDEKKRKNTLRTTSPTYEEMRDIFLIAGLFLTINTYKSVTLCPLS
ncbi:hypothetical protein [Vreelandella venusta]|uniref:hypothetical protein n=1 Tax=Vreelandella venusta TaxID=44935 RepID=UPI00384B7667